jgi:hypothetical protein
LQRINRQRISAGLVKILYHTDAAQAVGKILVDVEDLLVDYLTIVGHKVKIQGNQRRPPNNYFVSSSFTALEEVVSTSEARRLLHLSILCFSAEGKREGSDLAQRTPSFA